MAEGTVRWFGGKRPDGKTRGYGFILQDNGEEIFVHYSEIEKDKEGFKTLNEGQRVTFEVGEGQDGKAQALDVRVIGEAEASPAPSTVAAGEAVAAAETAPAAAIPDAEFAGVNEEPAAAEAPVLEVTDNDDDDDDDSEEADNDDNEDDNEEDDD